MLKIDLLPAHYVIARRNRKTLVLCIPVLVGVVAVWLLLLFNVKATIARTEKELEETTAIANKVRDLQQEATTKKGELAPIEAKVNFVKDADASGEPFWDRFHKINKYIYDRVLMTNFSITPPTSVSFTVEIQNTEDAGRFLINLMRCPYITGIQIGGNVGGGGEIRGTSGAAAAPAAGGEMGMPGGGPPPGMDMGPGGPGGPGMPGMPGGGGPAPAASAQGVITFSVTCTLKEPINLPSPPSGAPAGGGMSPDALPGEMGPGGPGGPGGPPGGPPGGGGGPPPGPPADGGGGGGGGDE